MSKSEFSEPSVFPLLTFFFKALASESGFLLLEFKVTPLSVHIQLWFPRAPNLLLPRALVAKARSVCVGRFSLGGAPN